LRAFVCIDGRDWEAVIRAVARYLREGEAVLAHVIDERAPRGYDLAIWGLLGRRRRQSEEEMAPVSEATARELLADAEDLLRQLRPELTLRSVVLSGSPNEELMTAANAAEAQTIFIGRGRPRFAAAGNGLGHPQRMEGEPSRRPGWALPRGWNRGSLPPAPGPRDPDPPQRRNAGRGTGNVAGRGSPRLQITASNSGRAVEAHRLPGEGPGKIPPGHAARFVVDHVLCDVILLRA
jgi:nucleotide-binding universal stress UspA family protein